MSNLKFGMSPDCYVARVICAKNRGLPQFFLAYSWLTLSKKSCRRPGYNYLFGTPEKEEVGLCFCC